MSEINEAQGQFETAEEAVKSSGTSVSAWIQAIKLQRDAEKDWRKKAKSVCEKYVNEGKDKSSFNVLYSNTQTISPAIYNSQPAPDIRERYEESQAGKYISRALERSIVYSADQYDMHSVIQDSVLDMVLPGRGSARVRYNPEFGPDGLISHQSVYCELVDWDSLIIGPAKRWADVPWIAFEHYMTRGQINALSPDIGPTVELTEICNGAKDEEVSRLPTMFKRALVYEIWDKETRTVTFITPSHRDEPLREGEAPFNLSDFFPIPRPLYAIRRTDSLVPCVPFSIYEDQADELDITTKRIKALTKCLKWRGVYAKAFGAFGEIEKAEDGEFIPTENDFEIMGGMGLDKAVLFMPIRDLMSVINELLAQREQIKQTIYEITGISDILRGSTKAQETLGAQQLKAQWGSLRISDMQADIQRFARDLIRMQVEIIAENFEPEVIKSMTNMEIPPQLLQIMRSDLSRRYTIDVETDSTIRADLSRSQENVSRFVQGIGSFIQAVGPAVQAGAMPKEVVVELLLSFARNFKLGRQAEAAIESMHNHPQQPKQQDDGGRKEELMLEKYKIDTDAKTRLQVAQMGNQTELQKEAMKAPRVVGNGVF